MLETPSEQSKPANAALEAAKRREKISQAEWRHRRAEVARLVAAGEDQAARELLAKAGVGPLPDEVSPLPRSAPLGEASPDADNGVLANSAGSAKSASGEPSHSKREEPPNKLVEPPKKQRAVSPKAKPATKRPASRDKQAVALAKQGRAPRTGATKRKRRNQKTTWADWFRSRPPWATSLATHGVLLGLFSLLSFATFGEPGFSLTATVGEDDAWTDMPTEITLDALVDEVESLPTESIDSLLDVTVETDLVSLIEPVSFEAPVDVGDLLALSSDALTAAVPSAASPSAGDGDATGAESRQSGKRAGGKSGRVSFFGAESEAQRVVFVVDNSGSMQSGRMETTLLELNNAVHRLSTSQEFYVVFFSDQAYPMFFPTPAEKPLQANRENKQKLTAWLHTVEICLGGRLLDAMEIAAGLEPDVVYLLTDGDIRSERVTERMTTPDAWAFTIHTLGMGARTPRHVAILSAIATNTGGVYRPVGANPAAVTRSRLRPIPYHRETGTVWGSAVQSWK